MARAGPAPFKVVREAMGLVHPVMEQGEGELPAIKVEAEPLNSPLSLGAVVAAVDTVPVQTFIR